MAHEFQAGEWAVDSDGDRVFVVGRDSEGDLICQESLYGDSMVWTNDELTPLPGCTGWNWTPTADPAPPAEFIPFESQADPLYIIATVERAEWVGAEFGDDLATSDECRELIPCGYTPAGRLFLLPYTDDAEGYRLLSIGEVIQSGDEGYTFSKWSSLICAVGLPVDVDHVPIRRKITHNAGQ